MLGWVCTVHYIKESIADWYYLIVGQLVWCSEGKIEFAIPKFIDIGTNLKFII